MGTGIGIHQLGGLLITAGMVITGFLGLAGILTPGPIIITLLFGAAVLLAYSLGKTHSKIG